MWTALGPALYLLQFDCPTRTPPTACSPHWCPAASVLFFCKSRRDAHFATSSLPQNACLLRFLAAAFVLNSNSLCSLVCPPQDVGSQRCLATLTGHSDAVYAIAVAADGTRAVSGSEDEVRVSHVLQYCPYCHTVRTARTPVLLLGVVGRGKMQAFKPAG